MKSCIVVLLLAVVATIAWAQVTVTVPDRVCMKGDTIEVPVWVKSVSGANVLAFQFALKFNKAVVKIVDVSVTGTLGGSSGWTVLPNSYADSMKIGAFGASALGSDTVLLKVKCTAVGNIGDTTRLDLCSLIFNAGTPTAVVSCGLFTVTSATAVGEAMGSLPAEFSLSQNYPNPFNPSTMIQYGVPSRSRVSLALFNPLGQMVRVLVDEEKEAGYHHVQLDASGLSSGTYFYQLKAGDVVKTNRLTLLK